LLAQALSLVWLFVASLYLFLSVFSVLIAWCRDSRLSCALRPWRDLSSPPYQTVFREAREAGGRPAGDFVSSLHSVDMKVIGGRHESLSAVSRAREVS